MKPVTDVFLLANWSWMVPKALVEASACGRPMVTTDTIGPREIIRDAYNGIMVPVRDPVALADALERVLRDDDLAERLRRNAYEEFLARHTRVENLRQTLAVFARLGLHVDMPADRPRPVAHASGTLQLDASDAIGEYGPTREEATRQTTS